MRPARTLLPFLVLAPLAAPQEVPNDPAAEDSALGPAISGEASSSALDLEGADAVLRGRLAGYETEETRSGAAFPWTLVPVQRGRNYDRFTLTFPSPAETEFEANATVHGRFFLPADREEQMPAVIVLHWKGGAIDLTDLIGDRIARSGMAALMLYLPHYGPRHTPGGGERARFDSADLDASLANYRQAVLDIRRGADWLAARPDVDGDRISLYGISLGSIVGSLVAGVDPRFEHCVFLVGGGDVAGIVMNPSRETRRVREAALERGVTADDFRAAWRQAEPLTYAARIRPESVLMVNASEDRVIPPACTIALQQAIGVEEVVWFSGGHHALLLNIPDVMRLSLAHLEGD